MEIIHVPPSMNSNDINPLAWKSNGHLRCKKLYSVLLFENTKGFKFDITLSMNIEV